jgi:hypothetical protein
VACKGIDTIGAIIDGDTSVNTGMGGDQHNPDFRVSKI